MLRTKGAPLPDSREAYYYSPKGRFYLGHAEAILRSRALHRLEGKIQLILTSPPFPLNRKKKYGNFQGPEYIRWLSNFAPLFARFLRPNGSVVLEIGNAWEQGTPTNSTLPLEALLEFKKEGNFHLCQEFICYNPARLPSPIQWVNIERIRVKDAFTRLWWLSPTPRPKADNHRILLPYSADMKQLLSTGKYNAGPRPSEYVIGKKSFLKDHGGAIPPNVIEVANTSSNDPYMKYCRKHGLDPHPSRMPMKVAMFFINFLTEEKDIVMDPFAGSNVTGATAEALDRRWVAMERDSAYAKASVGRFTAIDSKVRIRPGRPVGAKVGWSRFDTQPQ